MLPMPTDLAPVGVSTETARNNHLERIIPQRPHIRRCNHCLQTSKMHPVMLKHSSCKINTASREISPPFLKWEGGSGFQETTP